VSEIPFERAVDGSARAFALDIEAAPRGPIDVFERDVMQHLAKLALQNRHDVALPLDPGCFRHARFDRIGGRETNDGKIEQRGEVQSPPRIRRPGARTYDTTARRGRK